MHSVLTNKAFSALIVALALPALVFGVGLTDNPIVGNGLVLVSDRPWTATMDHSGTTIPAKVPGDLLTDLQTAGMIKDPLTDNNFLVHSDLWNGHVWTYKTTFALNSADYSAADELLLVFDGIKMGARIALNGVSLGIANDQFLRYQFPIKAAARVGDNHLEVEFPLTNDIDCDGRFMACTGGWDWAPYTDTFDQHKAQTMSKGIWKAVYVVPVVSAALTHLVPHVFYTGAYPTEPLVEHSHADFLVTVRVYLYSPLSASSQGSLRVCGSWQSDLCVDQTVTLKSGENIASANLTADGHVISLWWPSGVGRQPMYNVTVSYTPHNSKASLVDSRRIGFRTAYLVTVNDTNPEESAGQNGSGDFTMRYKVNGADIFARGANMIPMEEMEGRANEDAFRVLVESAKAANFNMLRIWGGGIFFYDIFYDLCDELGILLYHDFMYAQEGHSPLVTPTQTAEIQHQTRRLSAHPSIIVWDPCNECGGGGIYASFVIETVVGEDMSRVVWPSSPSTGWESGVDRLTGLPNGQPIKPRMASERIDNSLSRSGGSGADECTYVYGVDYNHGTTGEHPIAADEHICCTLCAQAPSGDCLAAVFNNGECWFKPASAVPFNVTAMPGRIAVWPKGHGPIPPSPPPGPPPPGPIETHGPYRHGAGFKTVNSKADYVVFDANLPPQLPAPMLTGPQQHGIFASEFGCVVFSSFESMTGTLSADHWGIHSTPVFEQRNYCCDNIIGIYFGKQNWNETGQAVFHKQLYQCMIGQALEMKSDIETRLSYNTWGTLIWQYNEIWPTGGWGCIEYGTPVEGQVVGGRWKPLMHWLEKSIYRDVTSTCGASGVCFVRNNGIEPRVSLHVALELVHFDTGKRSVINQITTSLSQGGGITKVFCAYGKSTTGSADCAPWSDAYAAAGCAAGGRDCILAITVSDGLTHALVTENIVALATPGEWNLHSGVQVNVTVFETSDEGARLTVTAPHVAVFVTLTTAAPGRFSDNAFLVTPQGTTIIRFIPSPTAPFDRHLFRSTLRAEHVGSYQ